MAAWCQLRERSWRGCLSIGLVLGRWWRTALISAAVAWPLALVVTDVIGLEPSLIVAAALGVANAGVGVLLHQTALRASRRLFATGHGSLAS